MWDQGLYESRMEKDSCGVGAIIDINGEATHEILEKSLTILKHMKHRGAVGADVTTGDGAGVMTQIPHDFFCESFKLEHITLPEKNEYAVGMIFLPRMPYARLFCEGVIEREVNQQGLKILGWRDVPVDPSACGFSARGTRPDVAQVFIDRCGYDERTFSLKCLMIRKMVCRHIEKESLNLEAFYFVSLSHKTLIYKGQILGYKLESYYLDLKDHRYKTAMAIVHERYSTNTFPSWSLAQPFRYLAHNGEINTITGNINWMKAREGVMTSDLLKNQLKDIMPIIEEGGSDSAALDNTLEFLMANGCDLSYALMFLIPESWQNDELMDEDVKSFYEYHARVMAPWDGPSALICSNGDQVAVKLDRNGLRPSRYAVTQKGKVVIASEVGVVDFDDDPFITKEIVKPGKILLIDMTKGCMVPDDYMKSKISRMHPYKKWVKDNRLTCDDIQVNAEIKVSRNETRLIKKAAFGYTPEDIKMIHQMAKEGKEPIGSMGVDESIAILSKTPHTLYDYFRQSFAQVTNPPIDPVNEKMVVSLKQFIGQSGQIMDKIETDRYQPYLMIDSPILTTEVLEDIKHATDIFHTATLPALFDIDRAEGLKLALNQLCDRAEALVRNGHDVIVISDRGMDPYHAPIPSLLALSAVHHHLIKAKLRTATDLIVETGEARDVMHIALLVGYGAKAINPYLTQEIIKSKGGSFKNYQKAIDHGLLKIISRMGIATLQSYHGAQIFEALGISTCVVDEYFTGTPSRIEGLTLETIEQKYKEKHKAAYTSQEVPMNRHKMFNKDIIQALHACSSKNDSAAFDHYNQMVLQQNLVLRDFLELKQCPAIDVSEVESKASIVKHFMISGMSLGSLSPEAHEAIAIAMNRLGGLSNSGEGGESVDRLTNNNERCSRIKQVASGRFGVTAQYLSHCDHIEIKLAQGAKPGEGGHLPGNKVTKKIAKTRFALEGKDLISPPPHHDIYSIEDLSQLIFDMKNMNPRAKVGVKLVAGYGVGTVAAGVAKAYADTILISGCDGGTGASAISSMKYVGLPWELGLSEAQQTLLLNDLRKKVKLQVDGKLRNGRDIVIAAILGAEVFGFGTLAMLGLGCVYCKQCHKGKCPVGIATQQEDLRARFKGDPTHLMNMFYHIAEDVRQIMASLGVKKLSDLIGRVDLLRPKKSIKDDVKLVDFSKILYKPTLPTRIHHKNTEYQNHQINRVLDQNIIREIESQPYETSYHFNVEINNTDRSFGTMTSGYLTHEQVEQPIHIDIKGSAGQSFGAFTVKNMLMRLEGECNDYVAKGLSGGHLSIFPPAALKDGASEHTIIGNTALYGATSGTVYIAGKAGQRFCVRNSGAQAVVEGVGNHGCEYMTGGKVLIIGEVGQNFAAGMTGGRAYVLDLNDQLNKCVNFDYVDLYDLTKEEQVLEVKEMLEAHVEHTDSRWGRKLLNKFDYYQCYIRVVQPR